MFVLLVAAGLSLRARMPVMKVGGFTCEVCKAIVTGVEDLLKDKKTEEEIAALIGAQCVLLPDEYQQQCKTMCETYVPLIMQYIEQGLESVDVCVKLGFCEAQAKNNSKNEAFIKLYNWLQLNLKEVSVGSVWKSVNTKCIKAEACLMVTVDNVHQLTNLLKNKVTAEEAVIQLGF